jgi:ABC-type nitrate/sulfonate/bicarbonate transport system permease component
MTTKPIVSASVKLIFLLACAIAWYEASAHALVSPLLLPPFTETMGDLWQVLRQGLFWPDLRVTLEELAAAFSLAASAGVMAGFWVSRSRFTIQVFDPLFSALYVIPTILLFPLFVLFFGLGSGSKIAMGATIAFFPIVMTTTAGLGNVDAGLAKAMKSMGASDLQMFWLVLLPAALPVVLSGLRIGLMQAFLAILGGETIAALAGLGHQIVNFSDTMDTPCMFAYIVLVLCIAAGLNAIVTGLEVFTRRSIG